MLFAVSAKLSMRTRTWPSAKGVSSRLRSCASGSASLRTRRVVVVMPATIRKTACPFNTGRPPWRQGWASGQVDLHVDVAARRVRIRADLVGSVDQGLGLGAVHAGQADVQARGDAIGIGDRAE